MPAPCLAETQRYLWRLITAPEGVGAALAAMEAGDPRQAALLAEVVAGDAAMSPVDRLDVYANMYFYRLLDSIREDYPAVLAVVGEQEFHNLITDYLLAHPPAHWSLRYAGRHLPTLLRRHRLADGRPWLAELAALEWAMLDAFDAADGPTLAAADLQNLPPDAWPDTRFTASPAIRLLAVDWGVDDVWERVQRDEPPGEPEPDARSLLVWRRDLRVYNRALDALEADCLGQLLRGEPFGVWCERAAETAGEGAAERVVRILQRWLADGLLSEVTVPA